MCAAAGLCVGTDRGALVGNLGLSREFFVCSARGGCFGRYDPLAVTLVEWQMAARWDHGMRVLFPLPTAQCFAWETGLPCARDRVQVRLLRCWWRRLRLLRKHRGSCSGRFVALAFVQGAQACSFFVWAGTLDCKSRGIACCLCTAEQRCYWVDCTWLAASHWECIGVGSFGSRVCALRVLRHPVSYTP